MAIRTTHPDEWRIRVCVWLLVLLGFTAVSLAQADPTLDDKRQTEPLPLDRPLKQLEPVVLKEGAQPLFFRSGDFNGDGSPDLVVVSHARHQFSIHLGTGTGEFLEPVVYAARGKEPRSAEVADFNADGHLDLAIGNHGSSTVSVFLGRGDGTFTPHGDPYDVGSKPRIVLAADLDHDTNLDLISANMGGGNVTVIRGDGTGTFSSPQHFNVTPAESGPCSPRSMVIDDFDRDGHADLAVSNSHGANVVLMFGDGAGGFELPRGITWDSDKAYSVQIEKADVNNDDRTDLIVANYFGASLTVVPGGASGSFGDPIHIPLAEYGFEPRCVKPTDIDQDGQIDLVIADAVRNRIGILLGDGMGGFRWGLSHDLLTPQEQAAFDELGSSYPHLNASVLATDLNNDSWPDIVAVRDYDSFAVLLNGEVTRPRSSADSVKSVSSASGALPSKPSAGRQFFVAPDGTSDGLGTRESPSNLSTALSDANRVRPGDTVVLQGGTYRGGVTARISGQEGARITVAAQPGEKVIIDTNDDDPLTDPTFAVSGSYLTFQDFELTSSDEGPRVSQTPGAAPDKPRGRVICRGAYNEFINLVIHDLDAGINFWADGAGGTVYGCCIYNIGWVGPDRPHGHGIYVQNEHGRKTIADNIIFQCSATGIHAYGSENAYLRDLTLEGNVIFNPETVPGEEQAGSRAILVGGGTAAEGIILRDNLTYYQNEEGVIDLGYLWGPVNGDLLATGNYFVGTVRFHRGWKDVRWVENTIVSRTQPAVHLQTPEGVNPEDYDWNGNRYFTSAKPILLDGTLLDMGQWQLRDCDATVSAIPQSPSTTDVFIRPNRYNPNRAHVIIYNWNHESAVGADLSPFLRRGDRFAVYHVAAINESPLMTGTYDGQLVPFSMLPVELPARRGFTQTSSGTLGPEFGAFVVLRD